MKALTWLLLLVFVFAQPAQAARALRNLPSLASLSGGNCPTGDNLRNRHYSPSLGRFLQRDPIRGAGGPNMYAAFGGDPISNMDPSGLQPIPTITGPFYIPPSEEQVDMAMDGARWFDHNRGTLTVLALLPAAIEGLAEAVGVRLGWFTSGSGGAVSGIKWKITQDSTGRVLGTGESVYGGTRLYRAVTDDELASITATGQYTMLDDITTKWYFETETQANAFAQHLVTKGYETRMTVTSARVSSDTLGKGVRRTVVDWEGPSWQLPANVHPMGPVDTHGAFP